MGAITLSVPDELKHKMEKTDWINWSSVARHAFIETLQDVKELDLRRKAREISGISEDDKREVRDYIIKNVVKSVKKTLKQGKKPMTSKELNQLLGLR
ncbi:MAG: hypothetical protein KJ674_00175 [Nanoarchaeota archaeon]|nr:hypothetical protein [Nanoarchaeota archaeon]